MDDFAAHIDSQRGLPWENIADFEHFYKTHFVKMVVLCAKIAEDEDLSSQLVQEAFFKIWEKRGSLKEVANPAAYLYQTVRNTALDYMRKMKRERVGVDIDPEAHHHEEGDGKDEMLSFVRNASQKLPEKCRVIFEMAYFEGLSNAEIADYLDLSPLTVKKQKAIGVQKVKEILIPAMQTLLVLFSYLSK
ncbi:sigma-70 family RNA polymerase sigma factor [Chitinophaga horti]|uniref:Sigma-70 family RNA polymerase sigma factor n=1 Tax=Chitinophaga horti TaxID=2920382 RepID=A0ABY6J7U0_9BACT|nr:sigma-70 family RNA polymerase sigma factor [Chitinophaga horti]UYQ94367.1 sigma-70 family RNA polymerase sigma factor [Chitinophaga horti]